MAKKASEWRRKLAERQAAVVEEITLPSGMVVDAKRPPLSEWIKRGQLPAGLMKLALDAFGDGKAGRDPQQALEQMKAEAAGQQKPEIDPAVLKDMKPGDFKELLHFTGYVVQQTVISPRIVAQVEGVGIIKFGELSEKPDQFMLTRGVPTGEYAIKGPAGWQITAASNAEGVVPVVRLIDPEEEIDAAEISDEDTTFIFNYAMTGSKEAKVAVAGGEMSAAEAATFRPNDTFPTGGQSSARVEGEAFDIHQG